MCWFGFPMTSPERDFGTLVSRSMRTGPIESSLEDGKTQQRVQGKISPEQFEQLKKALDPPEFRGQSGNPDGLIRWEFESLAAEIPLGDRWRVDGVRKWLDHEAWRLQWLNADGESPFPTSVARVVNWLKHFEPKDGKTFTYVEYPDICPSSGGLRLLQPSVAETSQP